MVMFSAETSPLLRRFLAAPGIALLCIGFATVPAYGQDKPLTAQQQRMKDCNAQAKSKKLSGDARKDFMSSCLRGESSAGGLSSQQQKMQTCNRQAAAKNLKGEERKGFMKECLSG
jgi:hypothetical protein